ncbi:MAG: alpha-D-ribose 1-methylphosphonate 5-triphosphate diphosphatase [Pseudomonadota bacterium]
MNSPICLAGGCVLRPDGSFETADVNIADGQIVDTQAGDTTRIDCRGYTVLPGIVDVHGDAFELEIHPRPGVDIAFPIAMGSVDRQLLANGITTAYHGLTISWEPGARSLDAGRRFMAGLADLRPRLMSDHRVQIRWETFAHDAIEDVAGWLHKEPTPSLAFNDHTTATLEMMGTAGERKLLKWAQRAGVTTEAYLAEAARVGERAPDVSTKIGEVARIARDAGAILLSHDDRKGAERGAYRDLGARVCEFPLELEAAEEARSAEEPVIMGGPNVIRGGSHMGALSAEDAVRDGICTVLASDYYYPSQINAAEQLVARGVKPFGEIWDLISRNAADAMGLGDRGQIEAGLRADLLVLDCSGPWRLVHTIAGGTVISFGR